MKPPPPGKPTLVIGLGNPLMSDEGVGIAVLNKLIERRDEFPDVAFEDLGTAGFRVVHAIAGRRKVIFIDAAFMDAPPGTIRRFTPAQAHTRKILPHLSAHEGDLLSLLKLSKALGECPDDVVIFGIQPESLTSSPNLSETLSTRMDAYAARVEKEIL